MFDLEPEKGNIPDRWVILDVEKRGKRRHSILAGFGAFEYRLSTGIVKVVQYPNGLYVETKSGSTYTLRHTSYGYTVMSASVLSQIKECAKGDYYFLLEEFENYESAIDGLKAANLLEGVAHSEPAIDVCCYHCLAGSGKKDSHGFPLIFSTFIVCNVCGNKRCPHATHHEEKCTNSNEPGQPGSRYE